MTETVDMLDFETLDGGDDVLLRSGAPQPTLTIAAHPQAGRVGETHQASRTGPRSVIELSRITPAFLRLADGRERPLVTPFISRQPVRLVTRRDGGITVDPGTGKGPLRVDGVVVTAPLQLSLAALEAGVTLELGRHVVLVLGTQRRRVAGAENDDLGLIGETDAMIAVRAAIRRVAVTGLPVLIRGETGTGKELAARAIHACSDRADADLVALNMAAVPASLAASELFGHARGAFSGAREARDGYFARADDGTLFLDEIGDAPDEVQAALLRALETGEIQQVGAQRMRKVDVRLIAATDADLEAAAKSGRFRGPLLYRLATQEVRLPPLRLRRADVGRLLVAFVAQRLSETGLSERLAPEPTDKNVWLSARLVARLVRYSWPGNVRQLRNVALAMAARAAQPDLLSADDPELLRLIEVPTSTTEPGPSVVASAPVPAPRKPRDIGADELFAVMSEFDFRLGPAAERFGISRPSLNALVDAHPRLRRASSLSAETLTEAIATAGDRPLWRVLEVSEPGLARRLKTLGLS
ncbi:MAG: DNA-binding NtrC family response regulator [Myxococcota bacterium]|jgi:DNA-binding NtrC family response regulator